MGSVQEVHVELGVYMQWLTTAGARLDIEDEQRSIQTGEGRMMEEQPESSCGNVMDS